MNNKNVDSLWSFNQTIGVLFLKAPNVYCNCHINFAAEQHANAKLLRH